MARKATQKKVPLDERHLSEPVIAAKREVQKLLEQIEKVEGKMTCCIWMWIPSDVGYLEQHIGVRVSEVSFSHDRAGYTYMQSEAPGLLRCAAVERAILARLIDAGDDEEIADADWRLRWAFTGRVPKGKR